MKALHKLTPRSPNSHSLFFHISSRFLNTPNPKPTLDEPSSAYYDDLIAAAGRNRDYAALHTLLNKRVRDGFFNTNNTFNFISTDLSLLPDLSRTLARLDKGFARKSAYDAVISRLSRLHRTDEALTLAAEMIRGGFGANACTFHPILNALTKKKKMEEAWRVMDLMRENQIWPDLMAYNNFLTGYCFAGDLTSAAGLLTRMAEDGLRADSRTYDALVLGACRAGKVEGALVVLRRMEDEGVPALYSTHAHVIGGLLGLGYYAQAVEFVMVFAGRDKGLDTENFGLLASRLINSKSFDKAMFVLEEMRKMGLKLSDKLKGFYDLRTKE
ncbi:hypothetical protein U1Q18_026292 [Sarracenia purpurea var. burkii]